MKLKKLRKKIQQLEKRLREGSQNLAKLKQKLQAAEAAKAMKAARKSAAPATAARPISKPSPSTGAKKPSSAKKAKKKLNLSPERRAQLAAAMKAGWSAKRAADASAKPASSDDQHAAPGPTPRPPESRPDGV